MDDPNNFDMAPSLPLMGEVLEDTMFEEINAWDISEGNVEVDQTPLQEQLQKNKESLEKKLMARRPMETLVEQGIVPGYRTNPSLHLQKRKLERAKTGDILRSKISHRPERTELVHRHILEDVRPDVDPSLCDRQRQLKRAKLADSLATQLSHRPGPLELIQKNILHTDEPVEQALKQGAIQFRPTTDGITSTPLPYDEDSSDTAPSPLGDRFLPISPPTQDLPSPSPNVPALIAQFTDTTPKVKSVRSESLGDINLNANSLSISDKSSTQIKRSGSVGGHGANLPDLLSTSSNSNLHELSKGPNLQRDAPGKEKKKVKSKAKPMAPPKPRVIKFHEYKGPDTTSKRKTSQSKKEKSAYDILLEQQQMILQWQLENKHKFPKILLPAPAKNESSGRISVGTSSTSGYMSGASSSQTSSLVNSPANSVPGTPRSSTPSTGTPTRSMILTPQDVNNATSLLNKLDGMKVNDLKVELKKRNLPVSGSKPVLVERLKPALEAVIAAGRKQFKQPYRQISIPHGGLIILKPSPNSQLLVNSDEKDDISQDSYMPPSTPQSMHEGTPDIDESSIDLSIGPSSPQLTRASLTSSGPTTPFSPIGLFSPSESIHESSPFEGRQTTTSSADLEMNLNYMEIEQHASLQVPAPPPPPPPNPLSKTLKPTQDPKPLPTPPGYQIDSSVSSPHQFLPLEKTSQQILQAKAQLEAQLCSTSNNITGQQSLTARAGPKGQFIWPPVSVQSSQGTVITIRAGATMSQSSGNSFEARMNETITSSKPIAQLAAVFSQPVSSVPQYQPLPLVVQLPQEPVPASELGMTLPPEFKQEQQANNDNLPSNPESSLTKNNEVFQTPTLELPATLPTTARRIELTIDEEKVGDPNEIIKQQQMQIEELKKALQRSNEQLRTQQTTLHSNDSMQQSSNAISEFDLQERLAEQSVSMPKDNSSTKVSEMFDFTDSTAMDDVIEILTKNGGKLNWLQPADNQNCVSDLSSANTNSGQTLKIGTNKPPSPPPLPGKNSPLEFPQLDFSDMSFDFGQVADIPEILPPHSQGTVGSGHDMEVDIDMDVQDWLDSLVVPVNKIDQ